MPRYSLAGTTGSTSQGQTPVTSPTPVTAPAQQPVVTTTTQTVNHTGTVNHAGTVQLNLTPAVTQQVIPPPPPNQPVVTQTPAPARRKRSVRSKLVIWILILALIGLGVWLLVRNWDSIKSKFASPVTAGKTDKFDVQTELGKLKVEDAKEDLLEKQRRRELRKKASEPSTEEVQWLPQVLPHNPKNGTMYVYIAPRDADKYGEIEANILVLGPGEQVWCVDKVTRSGVQHRGGVSDLTTTTDGKTVGREIEFWADKADGISYKVDKDHTEVELTSSTKGRETGGAWKLKRQWPDTKPVLFFFGNAAGDSLYDIWYDEPIKSDGKKVGQRSKQWGSAVSIVLSPLSPEELKKVPGAVEQLKVKK